MQIDGFLQFPGSSIQGESMDSEFMGAIEIWDFSVGDASSGGSFDLLNDESEKTLQKLEKEMPDLRQKDMMKQYREQMNKARRGTEERLKAASDVVSKQKRDRELTFTVKKTVDKATPALFRAYCKATHNAAKPSGGKDETQFEQAMLTFRKRFSTGEGAEFYLNYEFYKVGIDSYKLETSDDEEGVLEEEITFKFEKYRMQYRRPEAAIALGWNIAENKKF